MNMSGAKRSRETISPDDEIRNLLGDMFDRVCTYLTCKDFYHYITGTLCCDDRYGCYCKPVFEEKLSKNLIIAKRILIEIVSNSPHKCFKNTVTYKPNLELMVYILDGCGWIFEKFVIDVTEKNVLNTSLSAKIANMSAEFFERVAQKCLKTNCVSFFESLFSINYQFGEERTKIYIIESIKSRNNIWLFFINNLSSIDADSFTEEFWEQVSNNSAAREILRSIINYKTSPATLGTRVGDRSEHDGSPEPRRLGSECSESESCDKY